MSIDGRLNRNVNLKRLNYYLFNEANRAPLTKSLIATSAGLALVFIGEAFLNAKKGVKPSISKFKLLTTLSSSSIAVIAMAYLRVRQAKLNQSIPASSSVPLLSMPPPMSEKTLFENFKALAEATCKSTIAYFDSGDMGEKFARFSMVDCPKSTFPVTTMVQGKLRYLHANYVTPPGPTNYIATQYPTDLEGFTRLCFEKVDVIVNLLPEEEEKKLKAYFPQSPEEGERECTHGNISVRCISRKVEGAFTTYQYMMTEVETKSHNDTPKKITQIHFTQWPNFKIVPPKTMLALIEKIDFYAKQNPEVPVLVHCLTGNGPTGTLITAKTLVYLDSIGKLTADKSMQRIHRFILEGRKQRGLFYVQLPDQLSTLYALNDYLLAKKSR